MRVALVSEHASPLATLGGVDAGGQNVHVAALATGLAGLGAEVVVHTRRDDPALPDQVPLGHGVVVDHVTAGPARVIRKDDLPPHMPQFTHQLVRRWADDRPDVVHAHFWMSGRAAVDAAFTLRIPVVQTFHALGVTKRRHQGDADTSPAERLDVEAGLARSVDRVVATSSDEARELSALGAPTERVVVIPCGVDLDRFRPDGPTEPRTPEVPRVVVAGRLVERKGVDDVIRSLSRLPGVELIVAGGPDASELDADDEARRLRAVAADAGVAERVVLRGRVGHDELPALLRSADAVACVPWYEPFGLVALEAMACGVPVVASAVGGLRDTVVDGETGLHVPPRFPDAVAAALHVLLSERPLAHRLGRAGAHRARSRYGWDQVARSTLAVYSDVAQPEPLAMAGLRGPNAVTGLHGPNAMPGLHGPNAMAGGDR